MNKSLFKNKKRPGFEVQDKGDVTEIYIYDEIGFFGVDAQSFAQELKGVKGEVKIRINSPGGSVFDGMAIYNAIREHKSKTTTIVDGLAASAASYIALAGDEVHMAEGAFFMIHEPYTVMVGTADDMRKEADLLDKINDQIVQFYAQKSGKTSDEIKVKMKDETWFNGPEAFDFGLVDQVIEAQTAENLFDLSVFNNVPEKLAQPTDTGDRPARKEVESALRNVGFSRQEAKAFYSNGKKALTALEPIDEDGTWAAAKCLELSMRGI